MFRILTVIAFIFLPLSAQAAGIGVAPKSFDIQGEASSEIHSTISIHNTGERAALYSVHPDEYVRLISVESEQFRLEPGEARGLKVSFDSFPPGNYATNISVIAEELEDGDELPKTGVKIPVTINISGETAAYSGRLSTPIIALLLVGLFLLFISLQRYQHKNRLEKAVDMVQETVIQRSALAAVKHYLKHHSLVIISLIAVILAGGLLIWSFIASTRTIPEQAGDFSAGMTTVTLETPLGAQLYPVPISSGLTPFHALEYVADQYGVSLTYEPPTEIGVFVTEIAGYENGQEGKYWVYEIDGERIPVAADRMTIEPENSLVWKFTVPSDE
jgi:hypothetical protein